MAVAAAEPYRQAGGAVPGIARAGRTLVVVLALLADQSAEAQEEGFSTPASERRTPVARASITAVLQQARPWQPGRVDALREPGEQRGQGEGREGGEGREQPGRRQQRERRATYRVDATADVPAPAPGQARGSLVGHLRFGQGTELSTGPTYTGSFNSVAFEQAQESAFAVIAQLYYQIDLPLGRQGGQDNGRIVLTAGKIDPFAFFDQNEVSDDETGGFLSRLFVHNPLLDSGGDIGADRYGFTPGVRAAWFGGGRHTVGASLGLLGAGRGAEFSSSPGRPFLIAQLEVAPRDSHGETAGNYRLYGWRNPQAGGEDGEPARHVGWGVSIDQRLGKHSSAFARLGRRTRGTGAFDRALTLGAELNGSGWRRPQDAVGLAVGRLSLRRGGRSPSVPGATPRTSAAEEVVEIFYRHTPMDGIEISPFFQAVSHAAGNPSAPTLRFWGMRLKLAF